VADEADPTVATAVRLGKYLCEPDLLCIHHENPAKMDDIYSRHVTMRCRNHVGVPLEKPLERYVEDWLAMDDQPILLLLGDFGTERAFLPTLCSPTRHALGQGR